MKSHEIKGSQLVILLTHKSIKKEKKLLNFVRGDVFINNYTYVQQYTIKYMKIENEYIFPVLMDLLSLLFIFYIHNLIPFFRIHDLITFSKNYTAKDLCLQNKSRQKRILTCYPPGFNTEQSNICSLDLPTLVSILSMTQDY